MLRNRHLALGASAVGVPTHGRPDLWLVLAIPVGLIAGAGVARGNTGMIIAGVAVFIALAAVLVRPELILMVWFAAILADGRWLTYNQVGPLYVTEPLLALLTLGIVVRLLVAENGRYDFQTRKRALGFVLLLFVVMFVPAIAGVFFHTSAFDYPAARNLLLILYALFAVLVVAVTDLRHSYRQWFLAVLVGTTAALVLVAVGQAGAGIATSTGAVRIAAHTFVLAFGIAPIVLAAASREGFIRPSVALAAAVPFLICLVLVNHRSAWLAFVAAAAVVFGRRLTAPVIVGGATILVTGFILFTTTIGSTAPFGQEVARARTVTSTTDPNATYRLDFWKAVLAKSIDSPLIGAGFDPYPPSVIPPSTIDPESDLPAPHNSFVAIAYRIGFIPFLIVLGLLFDLVRRGYRASRVSPDRRDRAICSALTAIVVFVGVVSAFNVFLEAPYAGPLFWTAVGLLAYAVFADPFRARGGPARA